MVTRAQGMGMFAAGVLVGVLSMLVLVAGFVSGIQHRGVTVRVNTTKIAADVKADISAAVREELPRGVETMRQELPQRIAAEAGKRLADTRLEVGGLSLPVPGAAVQMVQARVEESLRAGINLAITSKEVDQMADRLSQQAAALVNRRLNELLANRTIPVEVVPGVTIPVRVVAE